MAISRVLREWSVHGTPDRPMAPVEAFRHRLAQLITTKFDGKYTLLAKRARIPVSTLEHYLHRAKHLPGAEPIGRMAEALGVSTDYLIDGREVVRPAELLAHPVLVYPEPFAEAPERERQIAVASFACSCPGECAFSQDPLPVRRTRLRSFIPAELVPQWHRLVGLRVTAPLATRRWPVGSRLILDWDDRAPRANQPVLYQVEGRCALGRLHRETAEQLIILPVHPDRMPPRLHVYRAAALRILGCVVLVIGPA